MSASRILRCAACLGCAGTFLMLALSIGNLGAVACTPGVALAAPDTLSMPNTYTIYLPHIERHTWVAAPLQNGSFEGSSSYWRDPNTGELHDSVSVPDEWTFYWDPSLYKLPEVRVIEAKYPYLDPSRIYSGTQALRWFTLFSNGDIGLYQPVPAEIGHIYRAQGYAHVWYSQLDDPYLSQWKDNETGITATILDGDPGMEVMIGLDPTGGQNPWSDDIVWTSENFYDEYDKVTVQATAEAPTITLFIRARTLYPFKHTDAYWDEVTLEVLH